MAFAGSEGSLWQTGTSGGAGQAADQSRWKAENLRPGENACVKQFGFFLPAECRNVRQAGNQRGEEPPGGVKNYPVDRVVENASRM